eukprot:31077-Pelagococcus_subviridis.AAC.3
MGEKRNAPELHRGVRASERRRRDERERLRVLDGQLPRGRDARADDADRVEQVGRARGGFRALVVDDAARARVDRAHRGLRLREVEPDAQEEFPLGYRDGVHRVRFDAALMSVGCAGVASARASSSRALRKCEDARGRIGQPELPERL